MIQRCDQSPPHIQMERFGKTMKNLTKRVSAFTAAIVIAACTACAAVSADDNDTYVYVTISDGALEVAAKPVSVYDVDSDGALTINDALYCAHEAFYEGGADAGYASAQSDWGLSLSKLWGIENGGSYGYYVNNTSAMSLADPVKSGDYVNAFVYTDTAAFSDKYCFFDTAYVSGVEGGDITLTLSGAGYDENWNPVTSPLSGAIITVDGADTDCVTDENGNTTITLDAGAHVISARSAEMSLVPPVCTAEISETAPQTGSGIMIALTGIISMAGAIIGYKKHEK